MKIRRNTWILFRDTISYF